MLRPRFVFLALCFEECGGIFFFFFNFFARKIDEKSVAYFGKNLHLKDMSGRRIIMASSSSPSMSQPQVNILGSSPSSASACLRLQSDLRSIRIEPPVVNT